MSRSITAGAARFGALGLLAVALGCAAIAALAFGQILESRYAGARVDVIKTLDQERADDPTWFSSGIGAGPTLAIARRIGFAWGHPIGLELSAAYLVHRLRRAEVDPLAVLYPAPDDIDGLEVGLHFTGTLFPDR